MAAQEDLGELRHELPQVWVEPVDVLRALALGELALRPGDLEVGDGRQQGLRRHGPIFAGGRALPSRSRIAAPWHAHL
jgi:hypothetical protein